VAAKANAAEKKPAGLKSPGTRHRRRTAHDGTGNKLARPGMIGYGIGLAAFIVAVVWAFPGEIEIGSMKSRAPATTRAAGGLPSEAQENIFIYLAIACCNGLPVTCLAATRLWTELGEIPSSNTLRNIFQRLCDSLDSSWALLFLAGFFYCIPDALSWAALSLCACRATRFGYVSRRILSRFFLQSSQPWMGGRPELITCGVVWLRRGRTLTERRGTPANSPRRRTDEPLRFGSPLE